ncbi:hypothetical protein EPUS_04509 [Endocarpon pusillum Z07020]|uniref:ML-like domain-containing protein n=1 Tax=Endocarpon pusillum (strain Z07020 / HMAS-L-300199) TaxID=1263415 RepID=U1FVK3_ENDPU|nr:uncharacterized protein EPUS_04509 [Endocarpon pusillum Z07020]ERF68857.1 hypothetical protein EPUS_04509 [Endocarpon pusillum Z07020]
MHFQLPSYIAFIATVITFTPYASAIRLIESRSLNPCQDNSNFTATLFNVVFTPDNRTLAFDVVGLSSIEGYVTAELQVIAYGFTAVSQTLDPCTMDLGGLCPMSTGQINIESNIIIGEDVINQIPGITYGIPDLDGLVRIYINDTDSATSIACVEAQLSNGKTVNQKAVGWTTAVIAGLGLVASGVTSGMGHSNTAAHVAANALSLFGFFQAQAIIGMTGVKLPPIVQSWTQNFQWSMGVIRVGFLQDICTWYQRSTGGTPTTLLSTLATTSVQVHKRSLDAMTNMYSMARDQILHKRTNGDSSVAENTKLIIVRGIERVGFQAGIEQTNIFLTGTIFFVVFCFFIGILIALFKAFCELAVKNGWMKVDKFQDFRNGWKLVLKGILFRLVLIGFPQMCVLCLWELTQRDSAAEVILAIVIFISMTATLCWAALKVIRLAKRSVDMHKNPGYMLYSDPKCLNRWGFLYVQYRATAYYFIIPLLAYILLKAIFIAFAQNAPVVQAIALFIIEAMFLIGVSVLRPWMDKKTNVFNIFIAAINFLNVILLLFFTQVFGQPGIVTGVMGVIFFILNAVFALVLLILVLIASVYAIASKNPDTRYQPMRDDRGSFIKSNPQLTTELDALGATARGDLKLPYGKTRLDDDEESFSSGSLARQQTDASNLPLPPPTANSTYQRGGSERHSPVDNQAMFPVDNTGRRGPPGGSEDRGMYNQGNNSSEYSQGYSRSQNQTPQPSNGGGHPRNGSSYPHPPHQPRQQNESSSWQRGAGYEH